MKSGVAYILPSLNVGGAEIQTISQINLLHREGYNVYLIVLSNEVPLYNSLELPDKNILCLNKKQFQYNFKGIVTSLMRIGRIIRFFKVNRIRTVFAVMPLAHVTSRAVKFLMWEKKWNFKLIIYHRAAFFDLNPANTLSKRFMNLLNAVLSEHLDDHMIYISHHVQSVIEANIKVRCPSSVIYNGVDMKSGNREVTKDFCSKYKIDTNKFLILVPGRLHPDKGQADVFRAVAELRENGMDLSGMLIIVAGDGSNREHLNELSDRLGIREVIRFLGVVPHHKLIGLYEISDLVIISSHFEGLGNVAIEALMTGTTAISSDAGGLKEVIRDGKTGYMYESGNIGQLSQRIGDVLSGNLSLLPPEQLKAAFRNKFSREAQLDQIIKLFND